MTRITLLLLFLLPGMVHAVMCRTVGPDGTVSYADVPAEECRQPVRLPESSTYAPRTTQPSSAEGAPASQAARFQGYESIDIVSPEDGGTVRSNDGRVPVVVGLEPGLQQSHFITAYLDGRAHQGRYGDSEIVLIDVDRGTHRLYVTVKDSKGQTLIKSGEISFTVQRISPELSVNPITGDDYVDDNDPRWVKILGCYACAAGSPYVDRDKRKRDEDRDKASRYEDRYRKVKAGPWITLWFPVREWESKPVRVFPVTKTLERVIKTEEGLKTVVETYNWVIKVPRTFLQTEAGFEARVRLVPSTYENLPVGKLPLESIPIASRTTSTYTVDPRLFGGFDDDRWQEDSTDQYSKDRDHFGADRETEFKPSPTTPGQTNPVYTPPGSTPGKTNPAFIPPN